MAIKQNPDGTWLLLDDNGINPPMQLPPQLAPRAPQNLGPSAGGHVAASARLGPASLGELMAKAGLDPADARPLPPPPAPLPESPMPDPLLDEMVVQPQRPASSRAPLPLPPPPPGAQEPLPPVVDPNDPLYMEPGLVPPPRLTADPTASAGPSLFSGDVPISAKQRMETGQDPLAPPVATAPASQQYTGSPNPTRIGTPTYGPELQLAEPASPATGASATGASATGAAAGDAATAEQKKLGSALRVKLQEKSGGGGYAPPQPAKDVLTTFNIKGGIPYTQEELDQLIEMYRARAMGAASAGDIVGAALGEAAVTQEKHAQAARDELADMQRQYREQQAELKERTSVLDSRINAIRKRAQENPVDRYWARKGAFGTFMTKLAIGLGNFSMMGGGLNTAYLSTKDEIEQEIGYQQRMIQGEVDAATAERGIIAELRQQGMSPGEALAAGRALLFEAAAAETRAQALKTESATARQAGMEVASKLSLDAYKDYLTYKAAASDEVSKNYKHKEATQGGRVGKKFNLWDFVLQETTKARQAGMNITPEQTIAAMELEGSLSPAAAGIMTRAQQSAREFDETRIVTVPDELRRKYPSLPKYLFSSSDKTGRGGPVDMQERLNAALDYERNMRRILQIVNNSSNFQSLPTESQAEIRTLAAHNAMLIKPAIGEALTAGEIDRVWGPLFSGNAEQFWTLESNTKKRLETTVDMAARQQEAVIRQLHDAPRAGPTGGYGSSAEKYLRIPEGVRKLPKR